jgi:hypothetical protein
MKLMTASATLTLGAQKSAIRACMVAALLMPIAMGCGGQTVSSGSSVASPSLKVTSTLDGLSTLPHHIHWVATPNVPEADVTEVDFMIDGQMRWIEHHVPYTYSDNDTFGLGYLVTSWLTPGEHAFTVRVLITSGRSAFDTVTARVDPAPEVPSALVGKWQRNIDTTNAPVEGSQGNPTNTPSPAGIYQITFDRRWIFDQFPGTFSIAESITKGTGDGEQFASDWEPGPTTFHVDGAVSHQVFNAATDQEGGSWCYWGGPGVDYTWSSNGNTVTLKPVGGVDPCGIRGFIWTGTWTRVSATP